MYFTPLPHHEPSIPECSAPSRVPSLALGSFAALDRACALWARFLWTMANAHEILVRAGLQVDADGLRTVGDAAGEGQARGDARGDLADLQLEPRLQPAA